MTVPPPARPKVSIVTICFNQAPFLERALRSVLDQDYPDIEYIVVDPGSTDGSREILARYRDRIDVLILDPDDGPPDGLNKGFAAASGALFGCLNADDVYLPGAVAAAVAAFAERPETDLVYANGVVIDEGDGLVRRVRSDRFGLWRFLYEGVMVLQQGTFFRREAFRRVGGFNAENRTCWDAELLVDIALAGGRFRHVDAYWGAFRIHDASITGSGRLNLAYRADLDRFRKKGGYSTAPLVAGVCRVAARVAKWVLNPRTLLYRVWDKVVGPPAIGR